MRLDDGREYTSIADWLYYFSKESTDIQDAISVVLARTPREIELFYRNCKAGDAIVFGCVPEKDRGVVAEISILGFTALILLDDTVDIHNRPDIIETTLESFRSEKTDQEESTDGFARDTLIAFRSIWESYTSRLEKGVNYSIFRERIKEGWVEMLESLLYASAVNRGEVPSDKFPPFTFENALRYFSPLMHHKIKHLEDYCFSPCLKEEDFDRGLVIATKAETATRLANWTRWKHELIQYETGRASRRDVTSGTIALAIDHGIVSYEKVTSFELSSNEIISSLMSNRFSAPELKKVCRGFSDRKRTAGEHIVVLMKAVVSEVVDLLEDPQYDFIGENYGKILAIVASAEAKAVE